MSESAGLPAGMEKFKWQPAFAERVKSLYCLSINAGFR